MKRFCLIALSAMVAVTPLVGQQPTPSFRGGVNLILVDVVVRDRSDAIVRGLTADDFELLEDGVRQQIVTFAFEEIGKSAPAIENASALAPSASAPAVAT